MSLRFPKPELKVLEVPYTAQERQAHAWLQEYTESRQKHVEGSSALQRTATEFVLKLLKKRMFSSPAAFATTLGQHEHTLGEATQARQGPAQAHPERAQGAGRAAG